MKQLFKSAALVVAVLAIGFGVQSCSTTKPIDKSKLAGHWVLETLEGKDVKKEYPGQAATLQFDFEKTSIAGIGGCNNYSGQFTLTDANEFSAPNLAMTMKLCMDMALENDFSKTMATEKMQVSVSDAGVLTFKKDEKALLTFKVGEAPQMGLLPLNAETLASDWKLVNMPGEDIAKLFGDRVPTMNITPEGKVHGFAGCNTMNTSYTLEGDQVTFAPAMTTRMACDHMEGEGKFTVALTTGALKATRIANKLSLSNDKGVIVFDFEQYTPEAK